jgi:thiamine pyrophosphate-dependent acetolactate synthase large subunit-like protein
MIVNYHSITVWHYFSHPPTVLSPNARYDKVLEAFGGNGYFVEKPEDIQKAMRESMANKKQASMVNIMINTMADRRVQVYNHNLHLTC